MDRRMNISNVADTIVDRGLVTAIMELIEPGEIEDEKLAELWQRAHYSIRDVQNYLRSKGEEI